MTVTLQMFSFQSLQSGKVHQHFIGIWVGTEGQHDIQELSKRIFGVFQQKNKPTFWGYFRGLNVRFILLITIFFTQLKQIVEFLASPKTGDLWASSVPVFQWYNRAFPDRVSTLFIDRFGDFFAPTFSNGSSWL